jgi:hypothetical protein
MLMFQSRFPKLSKDTIKDTLGHVADRRGPGAQKRWVLKD